MEEEFDIGIPKTLLWLSLRPGYAVFIQSRIITLYSTGTYYQMRLTERLPHISLLLGHKLKYLQKMKNVVFGKNNQKTI